jgi:hypothetical protein
VQILSDIFYTFVVSFAVAGGLAGLMGGAFLRKGFAGALASGGAFALGAAVAGLVVWGSAVWDLHLSPYAGMFFLPLAAAIGGYGLGRYLEREECGEGEEPS